MRLLFLEIKTRSGVTCHFSTWEVEVQGLGDGDLGDRDKEGLGERERK